MSSMEGISEIFVSESLSDDFGRLVRVHLVCAALHRQPGHPGVGQDVDDRRGLRRNVVHRRDALCRRPRRRRRHPG